MRRFWSTKYVAPAETTGAKPDGNALEKYMNKSYLRLLEVAKSLTGSSDIDTILEAATKIARAIDGNSDALDQINAYVETGYVYGPLYEFLSQLKIAHPTLGLAPFALYPFQKKLAQTLSETTESRVLINTARQMGVSYLLCGYALHEAMEKDDQRIVICSNTLGQAMELLNRVYEMIDSTEMWLRPTKIRNRDRVEFENGSSIRAKACSGDSLRGLSITHLIVDQAAFVSHSKEEDFYASVLPALAFGGKAVLASTPGIAAGAFYSMWTDGKPAERITLNWRDHPERGENWGDPWRDQLGEARWQQEFENKFIARDD
jgi:hypothetical protein